MKLILLALATIPIVAVAKDKSTHRGLLDEEKVQIFSTLIQNQNLEFGPGDVANGCPKGETLGQYISRLIVLGSSGNKHSLEVTCDKYSPKNSVLHLPDKAFAGKECKISSSTSDKEGENPWHYELIFRINSDFKKMDHERLACPGM